MKQKIVVLAQEFSEEILNILGKLPAEMAGPQYTALKNAKIQEIEVPVDTFIPEEPKPTKENANS